MLIQSNQRNDNKKFIHRINMGSLFFLITISLVVGLSVFCLFIYSCQNKQFDDIEGSKYRMLNDDDDDIKKDGN